MNYPRPIADLISDFSKLPSIGSRTAARLCMHLLEKDRKAGLDLANSLINAMNKITQCEKCHNFCEGSLCEICKSNNRDESKLCIVSMPMDIISIEQTSSFSGFYFVLMGVLSPLDGISPSDLNFNSLQKRLEDKNLKEIILAISPTPEGDATCHYVNQLALHAGKKITRISYGIPFGGSLDYADVHTLSHALQTRIEF